MYHTNRIVRSLSTTLICTALFFISSFSHSPSASALAMNPAGDYVSEPGVFRGPPYPQWQVVDTDPKGLNCRTNPAFSFDMDVSHPDVSKWAVLKIFKLGTKLQGVGGNNGNLPIQIEDNRGKSWIVISTTNNEKGNCLVRANSHFVRPLLPSGNVGWRCICRAKDCGSRQHPNSVQMDASIDPSSPEYSCRPVKNPVLNIIYGI
jgi:hypothetical protein